MASVLFKKLTQAQWEALSTKDGGTFYWVTKTGGGEDLYKGNIKLNNADDITTAIAALDADVDASGTAQHSGTFVVSGITEVDGVITGVDSIEVEAAGAAAALEATLAAVATSGDADDVAYDNTTSQLTATDVQAAIDEVVGGLGTAAAADVATSAIVESSTDDSLVSAAQVAAFVSSEIAGLEGAMHFRGIITRQEGETDAQAIARVITDPEAGDVVVMSDNAKEYIYDAATGTPSWREVGDETEFVKKTTTIAGVDLEDNITKTELLSALNVEDGAEVNIVESVQVNSSALTPDANRAVNITIAEGATDGTISVNGTDVSIHGLGTAAYTSSNSYDAAGTAQSLVDALTADDILYEEGTGGAADKSVDDALDELYAAIGSGGSVDDKISAAIGALDADVDASGTAQHSGTFVVSGVTEVDGVITAVDSVEVENAGAAAAVVGTSGDAASAATVYGAKAYADSLATNYDPAGSASAALSTAIGTSGDAATANTIYGAKAYADAAVAAGLVWEEVVGE